MTKTSRAGQIEAAAYEVLKEKGFKGASMLAIAKAARASNETLYKWYGDKTGLFAAMIERNTAVVEAELLRVQETGKTGLAALRAVGGALLAMVTAENAIALNRAAAGDITGTLGAVLAREGRGRVAPIIAGLMRETYGPVEDVSQRAECFISLLIGDLQIRRAIGTLGPLSEAEVDARTDRAIRQFHCIYPIG